MIPLPLIEASRFDIIVNAYLHMDPSFSRETAIQCVLALAESRQELTKMLSDALMWRPMPPIVIDERVREALLRSLGTEER